MTEANSSRGKRRLANLLFLFLFILTIGGFWNEQAWDMAKFYTPWIFPLAGVLYGVDEHYRTQRMRYTSRDGSIEHTTER